MILPFAGTLSDAVDTLAGLAALQLVAGDEVVIVDNQPGGVVPESERFRVVRDAEERSSYYARNRGVELALNEWILFIDADCRPSASLLDDLWGDSVHDGCGVIAGGVVSASAQSETAARYARSRSMVSETFHVQANEGGRPAGITANLLVRREAFDQVGGFHEGVFSGADIEFCWRLQELGWTLEHRPGGSVEHVHPSSIRALLRKAGRYGAGRRWVNRRYRGWAPHQPLVRPLARCVAGILVWLISFRFERALFKAIDGVWLLATARGFAFGDNRAVHSGEMSGRNRIFVADEFPAIGGPDMSTDGSVEALTRPSRVDRHKARAIRPAYAEDDLPIERYLAATWLLLRRPRVLVAERRKGLRQLVANAPAARRLARSGIAEIDALPGSQQRATLLRRLAGLSAH